MVLALDFCGCDGGEDAISAGGAGQRVGAFIVLDDVAGDAHLQVDEPAELALLRFGGHP